MSLTATVTATTAAAGVLIFANSRTCVGLPAEGPLGHRAGARLRTGGLLGARRRDVATTHRPARRPVAPGAIAGMTLRNEQSVRPTSQTTHPPCRIFTHAPTYSPASLAAQNSRVCASGNISGI